MLRSLRHRPLALTATAAAALLPGAALERLGSEPVGLSGELHFACVLAAGLVAAVASAALTAAGVRHRDGRTVLLGTAFSTMTALLAVHGLATPGVLTGPNGVVALAGGASLPVGGAVLALSAVPALRRPQRLAPLLALQGVLLAGVLALGAAGLLLPRLVPLVPAPRTAPALVLLAAGLAFYGLIAVRALRTSALTHRRADLAVAVGCAWLGAALVPQLVIGPGTAAYYAGHLVELAGVALVGIPAALDVVRGGASRPLVGDLSATEVVSAEEAYLGARMRALMVRLGDKDASTEQHTRRVALLAVRLGEELCLPAATLRDLAVGGLLHDIGKLAVPAAILRKPGRLEDHEFAAIKRHPEAGVRLLRELGGFPSAVLRLVAEHHERLDGSGYPAGLTAGDLDIASRILAVCDVYDALVSDRVYREAWAPERALALLRAEAGTGFDPECVAGLGRLVQRESVVIAPRTGPTLTRHLVRA